MEVNGDSLQSNTQCIEMQWASMDVAAEMELRGNGAQKGGLSETISDCMACEQFSPALGLRLGGFPATAEGLLSLRLSALSLPIADEGPA